jgi:hypothetical protein
MRFGSGWGSHRFASFGGAVLLSVAGGLDAAAQVGAIGGIGAPSIAPPPVSTERPDIFVKPGIADDAMIAGGWLIYPSAFVGGVYDSNVNQSGTNAISAGGVRLAPNLLAETTTDLTKTTIYGLADGRIYFGQGSNNDAIDVHSGVIETYQPLADLIFIAQGDYTRQKDLFSTLGSTHNVQNLNPTGIGLSPVANPQGYNQLTGGASVQKNFAQAFVIASGSIVGQIYDSNTSVSNLSANNVTYTGTMRGGFWMTPALYGYVEGSGDSRHQSVSSLDSSGYRIIGGVGTDQIGLVRGEVYGGYQAEDYSATGINTVGSAVYGVRGYYYPLPELTLNVAVDESLGVSLLGGTPTSPLGTATRVTTALGTAEYALSQEWAASGRGGYIHTEFVDNPRRDNSWTLGGTVTYHVLRNMGLTADYQHIQLSSNAAGQSFSRDVVTLGLTFKY